MTDNGQSEHIVALLGGIEPHGDMLSQPADEQLLYKVMSVEKFIRSISGRYLHFNRVDSYRDFPDADEHDGEQYPNDRKVNECKNFVTEPDFSIAKYYDQSRARTYACSFSLENSDYIWEKYGTGGTKGKVCVVFEFGKLRLMLNRTLQHENVALDYNGEKCRQVFDINYGIVEYVEWNTLRNDPTRLANPIQYTFFKDLKYSDEKELRVSLSTMGLGQFALNNGNIMQFSKSLKFDFDFRAAIESSTIHNIQSSTGSDKDYIYEELSKLHIKPKQR